MIANQENRGLPLRDVVILYVEDEARNYEEMNSLIKEHCSERSRHAKSLDTARRMIESKECEPHFVILDRSILQYEVEGSAADQKFGDRLYRFLVSRGIAVLLMTAMLPEELENEEPYRSHPPMGYMQKSPKEATLREAVGRYLAHREKGEGGDAGA